MAFVAEYDDHRPELRKGVADSIEVYPKARGSGNVVAVTATYTVHAPSGEVLQGPSSATITAIDGGSASKLVCAVSAVGTVDEGYQLRVTWNESGGVDQLQVVPFDVVMWPLGDPVSLNDILQERPAAQNEIASLATQLSMSSEQYAALLGYRARVIFEEQLRGLLEPHLKQGKWEERVDLQGYSGRVYLRGYAILDRRRTHRAQVMLAMRELYRTLMTGSSADEDPRRAMMEHCSSEADSAFRRMGDLQFDFTDNLVADADVSAFDGSIVMQRVQS